MLRKSSNLLWLEDEGFNFEQVLMRALVVKYPCAVFRNESLLELPFLAPTLLAQQL